MAVVNTNIGASLAQAALVKNQRSLDTAMEQLSTGSKINSAADDAAGLAINTRLTSQIMGLNMAVSNANDAINMVNTAEGALVEMENMLQRMRELALQASNGTTDVNDRTYLDSEYKALYAEIDRIADNTEWNGRTILDNSADGNASGFVEFQVGMDTGQVITVDFGNFTNVSGSGTFASFVSAGATAGTISATTTSQAQLKASAAIGAIDTALDAISNQRATLGGVANRLTHSVDNLTNISVNASASRSAIVDTDYAAATTDLARASIIAQAGTAMLAQANQLPQTVLALLQ
ncbi:flagellin [Luminiphilus sp.]|jgi:flagellin|nr:flagellin [Luminiphilus sp.]MDA9721701.1 flagellin [Luminiphilus sp.]